MLKHVVFAPLTYTFIHGGAGGLVVVVILYRKAGGLLERRRREAARTAAESDEGTRLKAVIVNRAAKPIG